ncbi:thiamine pyrophosphate-dependent enzyme [Stomatohabitans albus]|uniref:thiamine pyrophosphate-dependent enzyme n=1 Tax=Stomatohabitans albus TaxID=3110766 RepID=UPI00300CBA88
MTTGAQHIARTLLRRGITLIATRASLGTAPLHIAAQAANITVVKMPDAASVLRVADGAARRKGRTSVALLDGHDDVQDALGPWDEAVKAETPILIIVSCTEEPSIAEEQRGRYTKERKTLAEDLRYCLQEAATSPSGPVLWYVNDEALQDDATDRLAGENQVQVTHSDSGIEHVQLRRAAAMVDEAQRVLIWAGGGALRAQAGIEVAELADRIGAPVITTIQAVGLLPARHPCLVGLPPHLPAVGQLWDDADLVIAIGSDFDHHQMQGGLMPAPNKMIAINIDPDVGGTTYPPTVLLRGDAKIVTKALVAAVTYRGGTAAVRNRNEEIRRSSRAQLEETNPKDIELITALGAAIPDRGLVVADWSLVGSWLADLHEWTMPRSLAMAAREGQTRWAVAAWVGAALGAWSAKDDQPIIGITGEQGVLANLGVLASLAAINTTNEQVPATLVVIDDGGFGRLRAHLAMAGAPSFPAEVPTPDIAALVRTLGLRADRVNNVNELTSALNVHLATPDPTVLVVQTRPSLPASDAAVWYRRSNHAE